MLSVSDNSAGLISEASPGDSGNNRFLWLKRLECLLIIAYAISLPLSMTLSWGILIAGIVVSLLLWAGIARSAKGDVKELSIARAPLLVPLMALALAVMISGAAVGGVSEAVASVLSLKPLIVYFWAFSIFARHTRVISATIQCLLIVGAVAGLWGTIQQVSGFHPFSYQYLQGTGFLGGPMAFAGQMQILSLLALGLSLGRGYERFAWPLNRPGVFAAIAAANCLGVFFASERSAWMGFIAGVLVMAALWSSKALLRCLLVLTVVAGISWLTVPVVQQRLAPLANWQTDVGVRVRFFLWQEALNHWQKSPVTGVGIRRFPHFNIPEAIVPGRSVDINHAHSNYLHILTTTGILGLFAYLGLCIAALACAFRNYRQPITDSSDSFQRALSLGMLASILALMVSGIFEYNFGTSQVRLLQWFVLAMLVRLK